MRNCLMFTALLFTLIGGPVPVKADTTSTLLISAGIAAIAGAIIYNNGHKPYYNDRYGRRHYVRQDVAARYCNMHPRRCGYIHHPGRGLLNGRPWRF
jgi:hypothetical protein